MDTKTITTNYGTLQIAGRFALAEREDARPAIDRLDAAIRAALARIASDGHPPAILTIEGAGPASRSASDAPLIVEIEWDSRMTAATRERWTREAVQAVAAAIESEG